MTLFHRARRSLVIVSTLRALVRVKSLRAPVRLRMWGVVSRMAIVHDSRRQQARRGRRSAVHRRHRRSWMRVHRVGRHARIRAIGAWVHRPASLRRVGRITSSWRSVREARIGTPVTGRRARVRWPTWRWSAVGPHGRVCAGWRGAEPVRVALRWRRWRRTRRTSSGRVGSARFPATRTDPSASSTTSNSTCKDRVLTSAGR